MTLRELREAAGLTQVQLSDATGGVVAQETISKLELGRVRDPNYSTTAALAKALNLSIEVVADAIAETVAA